MVISHGNWLTLTIWRFIFVTSDYRAYYMPLTEKQTHVLKGVLVGALSAACIVAAGIYFNPFGYQVTLSPIDKLSVVFLWFLIPAVLLAVAIGRLAKHRFFTAEDIDGSALSVGTSRTTLLQSLLQNTLEQTLLAFLVYCAWATLMPATCLSVIPLSALAFGVGRFLFFMGYQNGAPSRAIGFTLTFYPSVAMLIVLAGMLLWRMFIVFF